ncbi:asparagine synthase (glutamine-hydrolyzing) [Helicobacter monodelphidis]|uniref:asparagine synthase (glutamine-hydrolyzing) n=1 Tax=Helicobacter sp. 15-1451 TaxID=2004995 RepID=UPI000DCB8FE2|nr:asparagine synthase (glutamine-hydrolyzing) [Helicobacter sp. 15-1451]RAX56710.1 asparagine synthase (glutamine-hydrolyzing) [Helicobacter sp. 15-1451]
MCGIAGIINHQVCSDSILKTLAHRGPDMQGAITFENTQLLHCRLSIQDLSDSAKQPMERGHLSIIFNGEIYNHHYLRQKIPHYAFKTQSDTETILALFEHFQTSCFEEFDGAFAFAILDKKEKKLILARDRMGKKPFFFYCYNHIFAFSSELNTLAKMQHLEIDKEQIQLYLRLGFFPQDSSPYQNVYAVPAGHFGIVSLQSPQKPSFKPYFNLLHHYQQPKITHPQEALATLENALDSAVQSRLESSSIEVGSFLSGGIDSSLIVAFASSHTNKLKTFTVAFEGAFDESALSRLVAQKYHTDHQRLEIDMSHLKDDIEKIISAYGRPYMDSSAIPSYYVSQEAKKHLSVVLNGDGADELFGGYRRYIPFANSILGITQFFSPFLSILPNPHKKQSLYTYLYRLLAMSKKRGVALYASATTDIFEDFYQFQQTPKNQELEQWIQSIFTDSSLTPLSRMLYLDSQLLLYCDLLPKMDIATMQHSLEARSPFLGLEILKLAPRLDDKLKINGKTTKFILRQLAQKYLPNELINAPKRGFEIPLNEWVNGELKEIIFERITKSEIIKEFIQPTFLEQCLYKPEMFPAQKRAKILFTLFGLGVWHHHYLRNLA